MKFSRPKGLPKSLPKSLPKAPRQVAQVSKSVASASAAVPKKLAKAKASVSSAGGNVKRKMQRFSIANVMGRKSGSGASDDEPRPSVISVMNLNKQLTDEVSSVHLFFGPQQAIFDGKDRTRALHGERRIQKNAKKFWLMSEPLSMERDSTTSLVGYPTEPNKNGSAISSSISAAGRFIGQKVAAMKLPASHVNEDSFCDGCGMDPIIGNMFTCSTCDNYNLCESCYQTGIHGYEDSKLLKNVREDFALRHIVDHCRNKVPEKVFEVLLKKVCKGQVDKFKFLATWISSVVLGHPLTSLSVRGIEIPHLDADTRQLLAELLTPVLAERTDLEVCMEWFCPDADNEELPNSRRRQETLRIWVATGKDSKSPFASRDSNRDGDTESDLSPNSMLDPLSSPGPGSPSTPSMTEGGLLGSPSASARSFGGFSSATSPRSDAVFPAMSPRSEMAGSPTMSPRSDMPISPAASPTFASLSLIGKDDADSEAASQDGSIAKSEDKEVATDGISVEVVKDTVEEGATKTKSIETALETESEDENETAYNSDSDGHSESSVIATKNVEHVTASGPASSGIEM